MTLFDTGVAPGADPSVNELVPQAPVEAPPATAVCRMVVAYDGTDFRGFAAQRDQRTVAGELTGALTKVLRTDIELACAGRTDAGVHAWGQVVSFAAPVDTDLDRVRTSVTAILGPEIVVRSAGFAPLGFDARHSAQWR